MSTPAFDLSKVQYTSVVNSFKNDSQVYTGSLTLSASIPAGSFLTASHSFTVDSPPVFSILYAYYQEATDVQQQHAVGSGYNGAEWYQASINTPFAVYTSSPVASAVQGIIYPVINGTTITVTAILNNPYSSTMTYGALTIPYAFIEYTMTN